VTGAAWTPEKRLTNRTMKNLFAKLLLLALTIGSVTMSCNSDQENSYFYRIPINQMMQDKTHFQLNKSLNRLYFTKGKVKQHLDNIPSINGSYFYLKGKKQIKLTSQLTGNINFYTYLNVQSLDKKGNIDFKIDLYAKNKSRNILHMTVKNTSQPIYQTIDIKKGDQILFRFTGRGIVYFSQPIVYKKPEQIDSTKSKHIIFIGVDTFRYDLVHKTVNSIPLTPNINKFIAESVFLKNTYAQTSWTLGSFMSVFTGLNEYNHEVGIKQSLSPQKPFLVEPLSNKFLTFGLHGGKVMNTRFGFSRGFDYYKKFKPAGALYPKGGQHLFNKAIELLQQANFPNLFLFLHTYQVHAPYTPPKEHLLRLSPNPSHFKIDLINFSEPQKTFEPLTDDIKETTTLLYEAEALAFDAYFGEFMDKLKKMGLYHNTLIILISDHGEEFFDHQGWGHSHNLYNELIQVPLFIKFPGGQFKNLHIDETTGLVDIMPTLLSYQGIPYPSDSLDGRNLMPLIRAKSKSQNDTRRGEPVVSSISIGRYFEALPTRIALMFDHYKLIYNAPFTEKELAYFNGFTLPPQPETFQLFNLKNDPAETMNIIDDYPRIKDKMMPLMQKIQKIIRKKTASIGKKKLDKEVKEQLKSLGYL
jgi:choline-sulfatase